MSFLFSLFAILCIALLLVDRFRVPTALAPFGACAVITLAMCWFGMLGLLTFAAAAIYITAFAALALTLRRTKSELRALAAKFFTPATVFFALASFAFYVVLRIKQPYFQQWDEFSFWGIAAKNVFERGQLYTLFESSMINTSYPPGLPVWNFFIQFATDSFSEWQVFLSYDVMIAAAMTMLFSRVKWRQPFSIAAMSVFSVFGLYMFWHSFLGVRLYATSCADIQVGVVFGAALISWFSQRDHTEGRYAVTVSSLMLLPMIKDVGLAFALVAAVVISVDMFASKNYPFRSDKNKNSLLCLLWPALLFVALLASYWLWSFHFTSVTAISRVEVHYEYSALQMFTGQDAYFNGILRTMFHELSVRQLVMFGPIRDMLVVFTLLPIVASALTLDKRSALKVSAASVLLLAGFFVYYLFQAYAYAAIFAHTDNFYLMSFERYIASYAIGWMAAVVALSRYDGDGRWTKFPENAVGSGIAAALVTAVFAFSPVNADQYLLTSSKVQLPIAPLREEFRESAVSLEPLLRAGDRIYFVCQGSDGEEWFYFNYEFQPAFVEKTIEGGNFIPPGAVRSKYDTYVDRAAFSAFLTEKQIDYVYLYRIDDYFKEEFAPMFADDLSGFLTSRHNLYRVALGGATLVEAAAQ